MSPPCWTFPLAFLLHVHVQMKSEKQTSMLGASGGVRRPIHYHLACMHTCTCTCTWTCRCAVQYSPVIHVAVLTPTYSCMCTHDTASSGEGSVGADPGAGTGTANLETHKEDWEVGEGDKQQTDHPGTGVRVPASSTLHTLLVHVHVCMCVMVYCHTTCVSPS